MSYHQKNNAMLGQDSGGVPRAVTDLVTPQQQQRFVELESVFPFRYSDPANFRHFLDFLDLDN